jgi:hyaluronoglucosaminidase
MNSTVCRCTTKSKFGKPFVVLWNSPTEGCHVNFSVNIELQKYGILTNSNQTWDGEVVTVFYNGQLGLYPFYRNEDKTMKYNDGLPQVRGFFWGFLGVFAT